MCFLAPAENSYEFPSCWRARIKNPLAFFKKRKGHLPTRPILHQLLGTAEHGAVARFASRVPELSVSNYFLKKSLNMQLLSQEQHRYHPCYFFKWRISTIFRRQIVLFKHTHFKNTCYLKGFHFFSQRGHLHSSVWAFHPHWHISAHKILQDPLTSSYVCIAKRRAGIQLHLSEAISRLDFWSKVRSTLNKEGNSAVSGEMNGSHGELLTTEWS